MTKNKTIFKYIFLSTYILFSVFIIVFEGGYLDLCRLIKFHQSFLLNIFILIIFLAILGLIYSYLFILNKFKSYIYYAIIPIFIFVISNTFFKKNKTKVLRNKLSFVTKAIVYKTGKATASFSISVSFRKYYDKEYKYLQTFVVTGRTRKCKRSIQIGDTVLLMYSKECPVIIDVYRVCPTKSELEKCQNDCYLIHGKLIPVDEVDEKDLWKY